MKHECSIVRDLLPLYIEELVSCISSDQPPGKNISFGTVYHIFCPLHSRASGENRADALDSRNLSVLRCAQIHVVTGREL